MPRLVIRCAAIAGLAAATVIGGSGSWAAGPGSNGPIPNSPELNSVSCPTSAMCMAVGTGVAASKGSVFVPVAAIWNGKNWRWTARPPERQRYSDFGAVSCPSPNRCFAVGSSSRTGIAFGDEWNGKTWRVLPKMASPTFRTATGISCVSTAYCVAVGGSGVAGPLRNAVAEFWNGTSWRRMHPVIPAGATSIGLSGVSCTSATNCLAVGEYGTGSGDVALAESWNGSSWTPHAAPSGLASFTGVACPRASLCVAVATGPHGGPASARWNGSTWQELTTPDPGGVAATLFGISCASATSCIDVGGSIFNPFAYRWTGGTGWTKLAIPDRAHELPNLAAVSCAKPSACLAVGTAKLNSIPGNVALSWNGSKWRVIRENNVDVLKAVSCSSGSFCLGVGSLLDNSDNTALLAEAWNGKAWRLVSRPDELGVFTGASCVSRTFCMVVGQDPAMVWNGSSWKTLAATSAGLRAVSCVSARFCLATGGSTGLAVWHGLKWRPEEAVFPSGSTTASLVSVSCASSSFCMAVGAYTLDPHAEVNSTLVNVWNGTKWRRLSSPNPGLNNAFNAVSCVAPGGCMSVGNYQDRSEHGHNLSVRWTGSKGQVIKMPGGFGFGSGLINGTTGPTAVSCSLASSCLSVGSYFDFSQSRNRELAAVWNGKAWRLTKPAGPASGLIDVSCPKPGSCLSVGQDVNLTLAETWNGSSWRLLRASNP